MSGTFLLAAPGVLHANSPAVSHAPDLMIRIFGYLLLIIVVVVIADLGDDYYECKLIGYN